MVDLEAAWRALPRSPQGLGRVRFICQRQADGTHHTPDRVTITRQAGLVGDRWSLSPAPNVEAQVTLMDFQVASLVAGPDRPLDGVGDNFLVDLDLSVPSLPVGSRLRIGSAILEVTAKPHRGCKKFQQRFGDAALEWIGQGSNAEGQWPERRLRGVNCRVIEGGTVALLDAIQVLGAAEREG
ncbi:MAG: hypothetical protein U1E65_33660 [Myxococcota bacterium]